jgi:glycine/D-amino acid oxidase-like deaminating enzyme
MSRPAFPSYADRCGWNAMLPSRQPRPPARGDIRVKYAVVGGGYTGFAAARRLAELDPSADIAVLEATTVGEGSSARNSGFTSPRDSAFGLSPADLRKAEAINRFATEGFEALRGLIAAHGIDCGLTLTGRIKAAATEAGERVVRDLLDGARKLGAPHAFLDAKAMETRIGSPYYRCGLFTEEGYLLQPAALIRGLADALPGSVALHERSPVIALERRGGRWELRTPQARIAAEQVVLATNAAVKHFGYLRDRLVVIYTYAAITEAMAEQDAARLGAAPAWGLLPAHRLGTTVRRVGPDRLMVRSLYAYERGLPMERVRAALTGCFNRRYPALSHVKLEHVWGGTTALTMNGSPAWGRLDEGLYASAGCNGSGIAKGTVLGKRLAETIVTGDPQAELRAAYGQASWIAPEPLRIAGFTVLSALERRRAGLEM